MSYTYENVQMQHTVLTFTSVCSDSTEVFRFLLDPGLLLLHGVSGRGAARQLLLRADTEVQSWLFNSLSALTSCSLRVEQSCSALKHLLQVYPVAYSFASCSVFPKLHSSLISCAVQRLESCVCLPNCRLCEQSDTDTEQNFAVIHSALNYTMTTLMTTQ